MNPDPTTFETRFRDLPPEDLAVLRERAKELARQPSPEAASETLEVLEIVSRGQRFAVPLDAVEGISEVTSVATLPRAPNFVRGLVSFRGEFLLCIELSSLVCTAESGIADLRRIVALSAGGRKLALLAEKGIAVKPVVATSFGASSIAKTPFVVGTDESFLTLLDPAPLIEHTFRALSGRG